MSFPEALDGQSLTVNQIMEVLSNIKIGGKYLTLGQIADEVGSRLG